MAKQKAAQASHSGPATSETMSNYTPGTQFDPFTEATGYGMKRGGTGLGNMLLKWSQAKAGISPRAPVENMGPFSDSARAADKEAFTSGGLASQPGAGLGKFLGEAITTPSFGRGGSLAGPASKFAKALGKRAGVRAAEGAISAGQTSDPGEGTGDMAGGALLSMTLGRLGDVGKRLGTGMVKKSDEALLLENMMQQQGVKPNLPLTNSASKADFPSSMTRFAYREVLPWVPGVAPRLESQRKKAMDDVELALRREGAPGNFQINADDLNNPDLLTRKIRDEFDRLYNDTVKSYAFNVPSTFRQDMEAQIRAADPKINKVSLARILRDSEKYIKQYSDGTAVIEGQNLLHFKDKMQELLGEAGRAEKNGYKAVRDWADTHIHNELSVGGVPQNLEDLATYEGLSPKWRAFSATVRAAKGKSSGHVAPEALAKTGQPLSPERSLAQVGSNVLSEKASTITPAGKTGIGIATLGGGMGLGVNPLIAGGALGVGHTMAAPGFQRILTGDTKAQNTLKETLEWLERKKLPPGQALGVARRGTSAQYGDE